MTEVLSRQIKDDKHLPKRNKALRMPEKMINGLKYGLICCMLITTIFVIKNIDLHHPIGFFGSKSFIYIAIAYVFIYLGWQVLNNNISVIPIEVMKEQKQKITSKEVNMGTTKDHKAMLIILIGYTFSFAFSLMVMIFLAVALISGTGVTRVIWNHFGEMMIETGLFVMAFVFVILGYIIAFLRFRRTKQYEKRRVDTNESNAV
jgi:hypothetical protein